MKNKKSYQRKRAGRPAGTRGRIGADRTFRTDGFFPEKAEGEQTAPITGIIEKHARGFGFLRREGEADIFIAPDNLGGAMNGDTVMVDLLPPYLWTKSKEGIVVRILERSTKEVVGTFQKNKHFGFVVPDDRKMTEDVYIKKDAFRSAANGDKVVAKITQYPDKQHSLEGRITEIIARKGQTGSDILSLIRSYGLFRPFRAASMRRPRRVPGKPLLRRRSQNGWICGKKSFSPSTDRMPRILTMRFPLKSSRTETIAWGCISPMSAIMWRRTVIWTRRRSNEEPVCI